MSEFRQKSSYIQLLLICGGAGCLMSLAAGSLGGIVVGLAVGCIASAGVWTKRLLAQAFGEVKQLRVTSREVAAKKAEWAEEQASHAGGLSSADASGKGALSPAAGGELSASNE